MSVSRPALVMTCAALLAMGSAGVHVLIEYRFARAGVLHESNVLFDADPNIYSVSFRTGRNVAQWGGRSFAHPNISNAVYPLITAGVALGHVVSPRADTAAIRADLSLTIAPLAAGGETAVLFLTVLELGADLLGALLIGLLSIVAFSGFVFGSIPESYALSGLAMAVLFWLAARTARTSRVVAW